MLGGTPRIAVVFSTELHRCGNVPEKTTQLRAALHTSISPKM
jgi:hypothetical protein